MEFKDHVYPYRCYVVVNSCIYVSFFLILLSVILDNANKRMVKNFTIPGLIAERYITNGQML